MAAKKSAKAAKAVTAEKNIGFLGFGNMGSALACALLSFCDEFEEGTYGMYAYSPRIEKRKKNGEIPDTISICGSAKELVEKCDYVFLAFKPKQTDAVFKELGDAFSGKVVISMVNALRTEELQRKAGKNARVLRIMPNTPVTTGHGVILADFENSLSPEDKALTASMLSKTGVFIPVEEACFEAATAISGCGPAFMYMIIEALGDAGVKYGLSRRLAYDLAAYTMAGAGSLASFFEDLHPGELKDAVCSPGGSTIKGVCALEEAGLRSAMIKAVDAVLS